MPRSKIIGPQGNLGRRNIAINGDMRIAQRSVGPVQAGNGNYVTVDRIQHWSYPSGDGTFTSTQSTGHQAETGHDTAIKLDVTAADTSIGAADYYEILQRIESKDVQHLRWGTSAAKKLQVSFWVRATKTGVNALFCSKQGSGQGYRNVVEYTINASDTWEHKTVEIPALTAAAAAYNDNTSYIQIGWPLAMGSNFHGGTPGTWTTNSFYSTPNSVNHMDSTSNDFYITGFQAEVGDFPTDFEHRSFAEEFALCERYFFTTYNYGATIGAASSASYLGRFLDNQHSYGSLQVPTVAMRSSPTRVIYNPVNGTIGQVRSDSNNHSANITATDVKGGGWIYANASVIGTSVSMKAHLTMDAEL